MSQELARQKIGEAYDIVATLTGAPTIAQLIGERDAALAAKAAAEAALAPLAAENVALKARIEAAKVEADQVVTEAQDARQKLE